MDVTAVILTKNEEDNISDCIKTLTWCNEIIVIDDNSTDKTTNLARKAKVKVIVHPLNKDFASQRNFALRQAKNDWVFFVDADERVTKNLQNEILSTLPKTNAESFYIKREDFLWGKLLEHGETGNVYLLRLAKKHTGIWVGRVHEVWVSNTKGEELKSVLYHYPHLTVSDFIDEINFYSSIRAQELFDQKVTTNWFYILMYPKAKFVQNYFLRMGFLDGIQGLLLAFFMSLHSFLVRGKLWLLWQKAK